MIVSECVWVCWLHRHSEKGKDLYENLNGAYIMDLKQRLLFIMEK